MDSQGAAQVGAQLHTQAALQHQGAGVLVSRLGGVQQREICVNLALQNQITADVHILCHAQASSHGHCCCCC